MTVAPKKSPVILCIEDKPRALFLRRAVLERSGYTVVSANSGSEALALFRAQDVDLVLSDHYLRGELGTAIAAEMKALKPDVPVLLISGAADITNTTHVDGVVSKAAGPTQLLVAIARALHL